MTSASKEGNSVYDQTVIISGSPVIANNKKGATVNVNDGVYTVDTSNATEENNIYLSHNDSRELGDEYAERQTIHLGQLKDRNATPGRTYRSDNYSGNGYRIL